MVSERAADHPRGGTRRGGADRRDCRRAARRVPGERCRSSRTTARATAPPRGQRRPVRRSSGSRHAGKGQALTLAERRAGPGRLLLCDADLRGDLRALAASGADLAIASFTRRQGGGMGLARGTARRLIRALGGIDVDEPLSGQRHLHGSRACSLLSGRGGIRGRDADDDRCRQGGRHRGGGRARPRASQHRPRPSGLRPSRPAARRSPAGRRPAGSQLPRSTAPPRRLGGRAGRARGGAGRGHRAGRRSVERARARVSSAPASRGDDGNREAGRDPGLGAAPHALTLRARS